MCLPRRPRNITRTQTKFSPPKSNTANFFWFCHLLLFCRRIPRLASSRFMSVLSLQYCRHQPTAKRGNKWEGRSAARILISFRTTAWFGYWFQFRRERVLVGKRRMKSQTPKVTHRAQSIARFSSGSELSPFTPPFASCLSSFSMNYFDDFFLAFVWLQTLRGIIIRCHKSPLKGFRLYKCLGCVHELYGLLMTFLEYSTDFT